MQTPNQPTLQRLEDRLAPAVAASFVNGSLTLTGDQTPNSILIVQTAANTLQVSANSKSLGLFNVTGNLNINGGNSADEVNIDLAAFTFSGNMTANLGNSGDTFDVIMSGGGVTGMFTVRGGLGDDTIGANGSSDAGVGTFAGLVTLDGSTGNDSVAIGNDNGVSTFQGSVFVTAANRIQWTRGSNDVFNGDVLFSPAGDTLPLDLQEGALGGTNQVTVGGSVRILGSSGDDRVFLRGMSINGELLGSMGAGKNTFALSSSAATVTVAQGSFSYVGGSGAENIDLRGGQMLGNVTINSFDGDDSIQLGSFGQQPTVIAGNLSISTGNGNINYGSGISALITGNVNIVQGNGNSTIPFTTGGFVTGRITVRTGGGATLLQFLGAQTYNVNAYLGAGNDTVQLNNAAASIFGVLDGGTGVNQFQQTAGNILSPFALYNF